MKKSWRRGVAGFVCLAFLMIYAPLAAWLSERLPEIKLLKLAYFAVAGTAWGLPLFPIVAWAEGFWPRRKPTGSTSSIDV